MEELHSLMADILDSGNQELIKAMDDRYLELRDGCYGNDFTGKLYRREER